MRRPSHYVLPFSLLLVVAFVATGQLHVRRDRPAAPEPRAPRTAEPVVVKAPQRRPAPAPRPRLLGRLLDPRGFVVAGAEVALDGGPTVRTNGDGVFELDVQDQQPCALRIAAAGFRPQLHRLFAPSPDPLWFLLEPGAPWDTAAAEPPAVPALQGEGFVRSANGQPLADALVVVAGSPFRTRTDGIGRYRIALPRDAEVIACADAGDGPGFVARSEPLRFDRETGVVPLPDLVPVRGSMLRGTVRGPGGRPLAGVPLRLCGLGLERTVESGQDGAFRIGGLLAGSYELLAMAWRGAIGRSQSVQVDTAVVDCDLQLLAPDERRLRVVDTRGEPVGEAYVAASTAGLRREVARSDADGWVTLSTPRAIAAIEVRNKELTELELRSAAAPDRLVVAMP